MTVLAKQIFCSDDSTDFDKFYNQNRDALRSSIK